MLKDFNLDNFKLIKNNEIYLNVYCDGIGPLVIMAHGWPESWYSWRHQIKFLVANGFSVAVLDMRGYGDSSKPHTITDYDIKKLTSDIIATADYLKAENFYLMGHDWGAPVVWNTCLDFESRVIKACGMSVPYMVSQNSPIETMKFLFKDYFFYMLYFQNEETVEKELEKEGVKITSGTGIDKELKKIDKLNQLIIYLTGLTHKKAVKSKEERDKHNSTLHWYGVIIILFLMFLAVSWYYIGPMIIKQKSYKINFTHIITSVGLIILFIGIFEVFFVETIVLQYAVTSSQETQDILMKTLDGEDICQN